MKGGRGTAVRSSSCPGAAAAGGAANTQLFVRTMLMVRGRARLFVVL